MNTRLNNLLLLLEKFENRQTNLAKAIKKSPAQIHQMIHGVRGIGDGMVRNIEQSLNLPMGWMDKPNTMLDLESLNQGASNIIVHGNGDILPDGFVLITEYATEFSAGPGCDFDDTITKAKPRAYRASFFSDKGINPKNCKGFMVRGDSAYPDIKNNDFILVDTADKNPIEGKFYAIRYGTQLKVKKVKKNLDGSILLISVNKDYNDELVPAELVNDQVEVIGRVRDRSGDDGF